MFGLQGLTQSDINTTVPCVAVANYLEITGGQQILVTRGALGTRVADPNADGNLADGLAAMRNFATTVFVQADPGEVHPLASDAPECAELARHATTLFGTLPGRGSR